MLKRSVRIIIFQAFFIDVATLLDLKGQLRNLFNLFSACFHCCSYVVRLKKIVQELVFLTIFINVATSLENIARKLKFLDVFIDLIVTNALLRMKDCLDSHFFGYFHRCSHIITIEKIVKKFVFCPHSLIQLCCQALPTAIAQYSPRSLFNILLIFLFLLFPGLLLLVNCLNRRKSMGKFLGWLQYVTLFL